MRFGSWWLQHDIKDDKQTAGGWGVRSGQDRQWHRGGKPLYSRLGSTTFNLCTRLGVAEARPTCRLGDALPK